MSSEVISRLISELKPHPRNYNNHSDRQVDDLALSLKRFGQRKPIVTWRDMIVAGHGLTMAAQMAGWTSILTMPIPDDWDEATVLAYLAADNELARQADPDLAQLAAITKELEGIDEELAKLAAGGDDALKALMAILEEQPPVDSEWGGAFNGLPTEDRSPFQQMTFTLHDSQADQVRRAVNIAFRLGDFTKSENQNGNGNALALICETFITGHDNS